MTINVADLVPFAAACRQLGIPQPSAERFLRQRPQCLPPVTRIGWERYVQHSDVERYAAEQRLEDSQLQTFAAALAWVTMGLRSGG
jgi:hypothetical protein